MTDEQRATTCSHCGSSDLAFGLRISQSVEVGHVGPQYKDGLLLIGTEPLMIDLCTACGQVQRFYVKNPSHRWVA